MTKYFACHQTDWVAGFVLLFCNAKKRTITKLLMKMYFFFFTVILTNVCVERAKQKWNDKKIQTISKSGRSNHIQRLVLFFTDILRTIVVGIFFLLHRNKRFDNKHCYQHIASINRMMVIYLCFINIRSFRLNAIWRTKEINNQVKN